MKKILFSIFVLYSVSSLNAQDLKTLSDSTDYAVGLLAAQKLINDGMNDANQEDLVKGLTDGLYGEPLLSLEEANKLYKEKIKIVKEKKMEMNKNVGEQFLEENAKKEGITVLPSGLQYEILTEGTGMHPETSDKVRTHYHGTLIDGTVFDSSVERNEPISFPLKAVISAWQEALPLMKVGGKWRIYSPYQLAYGERSAGPVIAPYSALIFEIELLGIE